MKKWAGPLFSLLLIIVLLWTPGLFHDSNKPTYGRQENQVLPAQYKEKEGKRGGDSYVQSLLKELKETVDRWLKSLNERIEREDVTHFEVRFLEILRSILEWVKEKIDSQIDSSDEDMREQKEKKQFREILQRVSPIYGIG
jgi:hemerythrin-like domain-containing protein